MQRSWWIVAALLGVLIICGETRAGGKPASLPNNHQIECPDCQEGGGRRQTGEEPSEPGHIDTVSPTFVRMYVEILLRQLSGTFAPDSTTREERTVVVDGRKTTQAQRSFDLAEFYRRTGNLGSARYYYQRVHSLLPTTPLGRLAIERLTEIENGLRDPEESSGDDESMYRQMQDRTMPLGLVTVTY